MFCWEALFCFLSNRSIPEHIAESGLYKSHQDMSQLVVCWKLETSAAKHSQHPASVVSASRDRPSPERTGTDGAAAPCTAQYPLARYLHRAGVTRTPGAQASRRVCTSQGREHLRVGILQGSWGPSPTDPKGDSLTSERAKSHVGCSPWNGVSAYHMSITDTRGDVCLVQDAERPALQRMWGAGLGRARDPIWEA